MKGVPRRNPPSGQQAGGTHPIGMLSCFKFIFLKFVTFGH